MSTLGARVRGRARFGWMDIVRFALGGIGMTVDAARPYKKRLKGEESLCAYVDAQGLLYHL